MAAGGVSRKHELLARFILAGLLIGVVLVLVVGWRSANAATVLRARMPENGGWTPGNLHAKVGEPLHLRLTSDDVKHSFAIGQMDEVPVDITPGEVSETTIIFDKPGKYTFYCTRWCGLNHWRMRGTIEVAGDGDFEPVQVQTPLYMKLGLDIDAEHQTTLVPIQRPSAARGAFLATALPHKFSTRDYFQSHSPAEAWQDLRAEAGLANLGDAEIWDLVAYIWRSQTSAPDLEAGRELYAANCAACHGEGAAGDGVFSLALGADTHSDDKHGTTSPTDFTDPAHMLGAAPAVLHGKILRGGMGTGMPYWGPIFTDDQIWTLVSYLWNFQFDYDMEVEG